LSHFGSIFQVPDDSRTAFAQCKARPDWYRVLGEIEKRQDLRCATIGDCIDSWREMLEGKAGWLPKFFFGEFSSVDDGADNGDPHMFFAGSDIVTQAANELSEPLHAMLRQRYTLNIDAVFPEVLKSAQGLSTSLSEASSARSAVVGLWG
jgi:hypothetical protein